MLSIIDVRKAPMQAAAMGDPQVTMRFNTKMVIHDLDDLGSPGLPILGNLHLAGGKRSIKQVAFKVLKCTFQEVW